MSTEPQIIPQLKVVPFTTNLNVPKDSHVAGKLAKWQLQELFTYSRKNDVDKGGNLDARSGAINMWSRIPNGKIDNVVSTLFINWESGEVFIEGSISHNPTERLLSPEEATEKWNDVLIKALTGKQESMEHLGFIKCPLCGTIMKMSIINDFVEHLMIKDKANVKGIAIGSQGSVIHLMINNQQKKIIFEGLEIKLVNG